MPSLEPRPKKEINRRKRKCIRRSRRKETETKKRHLLSPLPAFPFSFSRRPAHFLPLPPCRRRCVKEDELKLVGGTWEQKNKSTTSFTSSSAASVDRATTGVSRAAACAGTFPAASASSSCKKDELKLVRGTRKQKIRAEVLTFLRSGRTTTVTATYLVRGGPRGGRGPINGVVDMQPLPKNKSIE